MASISSAGIGSGLDVNSLVSQLMAVEQQPLTDLATKEASYQAQISAYGGIKSAMSSFQTALQSLNTPTKFSSMFASSSDLTVMSATATGSATPGSYAVNVTTLAQAQKLASAGFASTGSVVGSGTLTFQFGSVSGTAFNLNGNKAAQTVTIAPGQNTLAGIRDAVNAAGIGVTATIVNDGSTNGNRLVFTSNDSGAANSLKITVGDADGNATDAAGLSQLAYDPAAKAGAGKNMTENVAAQDATLTVDGIAVTKPSNTITDAIQGATINLVKAGASTLTVSRDTASVSTAVQSFVKAYNDASTALTSVSSYDSSTKQGGVLLGDSGVLAMQTQMRAMVGRPAAGVTGAYTLLSQVGVSFQKDGTLALDTTKLSAALSSNPTDVAALFAAVGNTTDSQVSYIASGTNTQAGTYAVNVSRMAAQGTQTGSAAAGLTITAGSNDNLTVLVDGVSANVTLSAGTYASADALAAEVQSKINGASALSAAGLGVTVTSNAGVMSIVSKSWGSQSAVTIAGAGASSLLGGAPTTTTGADVAATINGAPATGKGQLLVGPPGTAVDGLTLQVTGGTTGLRGAVTYSKGMAAQLNDMVTNFLDSSGTIASRTDGLNQSIKDIGNQRDQVNARLTAKEAAYRAQFTALDTMISSMQSTSSFLTQQLNALAAIAPTSSSK